MKKYRIVQRKDLNGKSIFKIQQRLLWLFWVYQIHPEGYPSASFSGIEDAQNEINSLIITKTVCQ